MFATLRGRRRGFTLVELLASIGVLAVIGSVVTTVFVDAARMAELARAYSEIYQTARNVFKMVESDLQGSFVDSDGRLFIGLLNPLQDRTDALQLDPWEGYVDDPEYIALIANVGSSALRRWQPLESTVARAVRTGDWNRPAQSFLVFTTTTASPDGLTAARMYYLLSGNNLYRVPQLDSGVDNLDYGYAVLAAVGGTLDFAEAQRAFLLSDNILQFRLRYLPHYDLNRDSTTYNAGGYYQLSDALADGLGGDWAYSWHPRFAPAAPRTTNVIEWDTYYSGEGVDLPTVNTVLPRAVEITLVVTDSKNIMVDEFGNSVGFAFRDVVYLPMAP